MVGFGFLLMTFVAAYSEQQMDCFKETQSCQDTSELIFNTVPVISTFECARLCMDSDHCRSFTVKLGTPITCNLNADKLTDKGCSDQTLQHYNSMTVSSNPCLHGGLFYDDDETCRCFHGYVGTIYCSEGMDSGHYPELNQIFNIHPPTSPASFPVWCEMRHGGMGNDRLLVYYVSNYRYMTLVLKILTDQEFSYFNHKQRFYSGFKVGPESSGFNCTYDTTYPNTWENNIHNLDDCLANQKMMPFTTIYVDNDMGAGGNCAATHLSGWWYSYYGGCNPTGKLQPMSDTYQSGDPTYLSIPVNNSWTAKSTCS